VSDELGTQDLANESSKVGSNVAHTFFEVLGEAFTELNELNTSLSPLFDLQSVGVVHFHSHGDFGGVKALLSFSFVKQDSGHLVLE